ncbi:acetate--CoA ligase family protein [Candidatus Woesearchaeota archaeon]|nr:acetate--CoA ligase family protein [Candidatus Woesearchaeota archaeon]
MERILAEKEAEAFLEQEGFPVTERSFVTTEKDAVHAAHRLGFPVCLKVSSQHILHKSDVGGVKIDLRTDHEVLEAFRHLIKIPRCEEVMVQPYNTGHLVLVGVQRDPTFGHTIAVGSGGIYTELLKDVAFRICPLSHHDAKEMVEELQIYPMLQGARGEQPANLEKLHQLLLKLSHLALCYPHLRELDINPVIFHGEDLHIADARIVFD